MKAFTLTTIVLSYITSIHALPSIFGTLEDGIVPGKFFVEMKPTNNRVAGGIEEDADRLRNILAGLRISQDENVPSVKNQFEIEDYRTLLVEGSDSVQKLLAEHEDIESVHPNKIVTMSGLQSDAPWGLVRMANRNPDEQSTKYEYSDAAGEGVDVYVIDTGVFIEHNEFEGRAAWGASFVEEGQQVDDNGHGTHVAGTIASKTFGVAKKAHIIAVRVLDGRGSGTTESVLSGMQFVADAARNSSRKSVANMSIGGSYDKVLNNAANAMASAGVYVVVAAGNENQNACKVSPASALGVLTVGAINIDEKRSSFTNWGKCVDIFAPGVDILSTWNDGVKATKSASGTSMASPNVAGVVALVLSTKTFDSVAEGFDYIKSIGTANRLTGIKGAANIIAYNGFVDGVEVNPRPIPEPLTCPYINCWFRFECDSCKGIFA